MILKVCRLDVDDDMSMPHALSILNEEERRHLGRFRSRLHGSRYARARAFLRKELAQWTNAAPNALRFGKGANGKPFLEGGPHFNLTHSEGFAVLATCHTAPIGVDLEMLTQDIDVDGLAVECLTLEETRVLDTLCDADRKSRFLVFWTVKESRMKMTGEGLSLAPSMVHLELVDGWPVGIAAPATPPTLIARPELGIPGGICSMAMMLPNKPGSAVSPSP